MFSIACVALCLCTSVEGLKFSKHEDSARRYGAKKDGLEINVDHKAAKGKPMKELKEDEVSVSIALGRKMFQFDILKTGERTGTLTIGSTGDELTDDEKIQLRSFSNELLEDEAPANRRVGLGSKLMEYLSQMPGSRTLGNRTMDIKLRAMQSGKEKPAPPEDAPTRRSRRLLSEVCNGITVDTREGATTCPSLLARRSDWYYFWYSFWYAGDDGTTCMCPYGGGALWAAYYTGVDGVYRWMRKHGSDTSQCTGRCGMGCNSWDKEAFQDCFDHDVCVSHYGGSVYAWNIDCGDEFLEAADDYVASYGWSCCPTSSFWDWFSWW